MSIDLAGYYVGHNFDDRYYTKTELDARLDALDGSNILDGSLSSSDLGAAGAAGALRDTVVGSAVPNLTVCNTGLSALAIPVG